MRPNEPLKKELQTKDMTVRGDIVPEIRKDESEDPRAVIERTAQKDEEPGDNDPAQPWNWPADK